MAQTEKNDNMDQSREKMREVEPGVRKNEQLLYYIWQHVAPTML